MMANSVIYEKFKFMERSKVNNGLHLASFMALGFPSVMDRFITVHEGDKGIEYLKAICGMISPNDSAESRKYQNEAAKYNTFDAEGYSYTLNAAYNELAFDTYLDGNTQEYIDGYLICAYLLCPIENFPDVERRDTACELLDTLLTWEEQGAEFDITQMACWGTIAMNADFDSWYVKNRGELPLMKSNTSSSMSGQQENQKGCYVATAIYGSYDCPEVWTLRRYRDYHLSGTYYGRLFVRLYYRVSPRIVKMFGNKQWFNFFWKNMLDRFVDRLMRDGYENTPYND